VDGDSFYHSGRLHRGVWLFDRPAGGGEDNTADSRTVVVGIPTIWLYATNGLKRIGATDNF
jgi:hypothetical protein